MFFVNFSITSYARTDLDINGNMFKNITGNASGPIKTNRINIIDFMIFFLKKNIIKKKFLKIKLFTCKKWKKRNGRARARRHVNLG